jgi:hypothetical protein
MLLTIFVLDDKTVYHKRTPNYQKLTLKNCFQSGPFQPSGNRPKNQPKIAKTRLKCLVKWREAVAQQGARRATVTVKIKCQ